MAKVAVVESTLSKNFPFRRVQSDVKMKRKTPSELRGEQLKRRNGEFNLDQQWAAAADLACDMIDLGETNAPKKPEKIQRYINTRVNEVFPVKKSSERCRVLYGKERAKGPSNLSKTFGDVITSSVASHPSDQPAPSCKKADNHNILEHSNSSTKESSEQCFRNIEKCTQSALRNVVELHLGNDKPSDDTKVDMQKALKGLVARDIPAISGSRADSDGKRAQFPSVSPGSFCPEFHIPGRKAPLDFTLKTRLRLVSSSSVKWCHKLSANPTSTGHFNSQSFCDKEQKSGCASVPSLTVDTLYTKALHSWLYPQSSLPASIISAMALSAVKGEKDFLSQRQQDWEDSFRNLYYMLRKNMCNIFYVCTAQFVVLFTGCKFLGKKHSCNAYLSQSTRGLRSLLTKHDISFSMPLCGVEVEQAAEDDLVELSEIEKQNLGQTVQMDSMSDTDNSPQSLLAFIGNENVHGLYDFLLNYRFFLNSLTGVDVPVLYAPVPFHNGSLSIPEVRCREMKRADTSLPCSSGSDADGAEASFASSGTAICHSIEIKDTILPPWIITGICAAMSADGGSFESSFTTEPTSLGLNLALDSICHKSEPSIDSDDILGIPQVVPSTLLRSASLMNLKYSNGSYVAYVSPI